jgi:hypothetical protein
MEDPKKASGSITAHKCLDTLLAYSLNRKNLFSWVRCNFTFLARL